MSVGSGLRLGVHAFVEEAFVDLLAEGQAELLELGLDLIEGLLAEVAVL
jgi:hypothetical protein